MQDKLKKISFVIVIILMLVLPICNKAFATGTTGIIEEIEYSDDFKAWLELSEEEKKETIMPKMYIEDDEKNQIKNLLNEANLQSASSLERYYSLEDIIPENIQIRRQGSRGTCWAFASLRALETNLALKDYFNGFVAKSYNFSEKHMEYATTRSFADGTNYNGFTRSLDRGGTFEVARAYLTNGAGAVPESEMPYTSDDLSVDWAPKINLSEIENKTISSKVLDTVTFPSYSASTITEEEMNEIKSYIKQYGGIYTCMCSASVYRNKYSDTEVAHYNTVSTNLNHAVTIIGWDDDFSKDNFYTTSSYQSRTKPKENGAWIVKNSQSEDRDTIYISYESIDVYYYLYGITNASTNIDYERIYQWDRFGYSKIFKYTFPSDDTHKVYLANVFDRKTEDTEYLTEVSIYTGSGTTCKVYINQNYVIPEGSIIEDGKGLTEGYVEAKLKAGDSETFEYTGYHTLEFEEPIELSGDYFVVIVEIQTDESYVKLYMEKPISDTYWENTTYTGKCFYGGETAFKENEDWVNFEEKSADSTIKAFTTSKVVDDSLKEIVVTTAPEKTEYIEGQSFDETGMVVTAVFNNGVSRELVSGENAKYVIENEEVLSLEKPVTVSYTYEGETFKAEVPITVNRNRAVALEITKEPYTVEYYEGQNFETEGMEVTATLLDGSKEIVEDYKVVNGENLQFGQETITISYDGVTIEQEIRVIEKKLESIKVTKVPAKTTYIEGQNFEADGMEITATYNDGDKKVITDYKVTDGENLTLGKTSVTISYTEEGITKTAEQKITVLERLKVSFEEYEEVELDNKNHIKHIKVNETIEEMKEKITTNGEIKIYQGENEITEAKEKLATGMIVQITLREESEEYTVIVTGDTNGDSKVNIFDILAINRHRLNKVNLDEEYLLAGDVTGDGKVNLNDILKINRYRLGKIDSL